MLWARLDGTPGGGSYAPGDELPEFEHPPPIPWEVLTPKEMFILRELYYRGRTVRAVAALLGVTHPTVLRYRDMALAKLREAYERHKS